MQRPDIVFLVLDTQRVDRLSSYGHHLETSPAFDSFAADATMFRHALAAAQWTIPSHSSMFTGLYPSAHTTVQSFSRLPQTIPTLAERLRDGGYYTAAFCNNPLVGVVNNGLRRGFLSFLNYSGWLTSRPNQAGVHPSFIDRYRQFFKRTLAALVNRIQDAFARSDVLLSLSFTPLMVPLWQTALSFKGNTRKSLDDAARLLIDRRGVAPDQPVFSFINLMGTHLPYHPARPAMERFAPHVLHDRQRRHYLRRFNSDIYGWLAPLTGAITDEQKAIIDSMYNAEVYTQDQQLGRFFAALRSSGRLDSTLVVICADHGDHLGEKQLVGHLFSLYNELVHVPLVIRDPAGDLPRGTIREGFVSTRRLFQTVLTAANLASQEEQHYTLAHTNGSDPDGGRVFAEGVPPQNVVNMIQRRQPELATARRCDQTRRAVWQGQHKLIQTGNEHLELYRVVEDPREQHDLADRVPQEVARLQNQLAYLVGTNGTNGTHPTNGANGNHSPDQTATGHHLPEQIDEATDPEVARRLRDLGYLE